MSGNGKSQADYVRLAITRIDKAHAAAVEASLKGPPDHTARPRELVTAVHLLEAAETMLREWLKQQPQR